MNNHTETENSTILPINAASSSAAASTTTGNNNGTITADTVEHQVVTTTTTINYKDHHEDELNNQISNIRVCNLSVSSTESSPTSADSHSNGSGLTRYSDRNLIINYIPSSLTDSDLLLLFNKIGPVKNCRIIRDKHSQQSFGFGFCEFEAADDAQKAIDSFNGYNLSGKILKVAFARLPGQESKNCNLFVQNLPSNVDQNELQKVFSRYGQIVQCRLIVDNQGHSKRIGFVLYENRTCATAARNALNNCIWPGENDGLASNTNDNSLIDGKDEESHDIGIDRRDDKKMNDRIDNLVKVQFAAENSKKCRSVLGVGNGSGGNMLADLSPSQLLGGHSTPTGMLPASLANWCSTPPAIPVMPIGGMNTNNSVHSIAALINAQQNGSNSQAAAAASPAQSYWLNPMSLPFAMATASPAGALLTAVTMPQNNNANASSMQSHNATATAVSLPQSCNVPISAAAYRSGLAQPHFFNASGIRNSTSAFFTPTQQFTSPGATGASSNVNASNSNNLNNPFLLATPNNHHHHHATGFSLGLLNSTHSPNGQIPFAHMSTNGNPMDLSTAAAYFTGGAAASLANGHHNSNNSSGNNNNYRGHAASSTRNSNNNNNNPMNHASNNTLQQLSPPTEPPYVVYIYNIGNSMSEDKLRDIFKPYGNPKKIDLPRESGGTISGGGSLSPDGTGGGSLVRSKNFGFVTFDDVDSAMKAIRGLNGSTLDGRQLQASFRKEKPSLRPITGGGGVGVVGVGGIGNGGLVGVSGNRNNMSIVRTTSVKNVNIGVPPTLCGSTATAM